MSSKIATRSAKRAKMAEVRARQGDDSSDDDDDDSDDYDYDDRPAIADYIVSPHIQRCEETSPPGPFEYINILDIPFSSTCKTFIERCRVNFTRGAHPWIWIRIDASLSKLWKDGIGTFRVTNIEEIEFLFHKLSDWSIKNPGVPFPEFGVLVKTVTKIDVVVI